MRDKAWRVKGTPILINFAEAPAFGSGPIMVDVQYSIPEYDILDASGVVLRHFSLKQSETFMITLKRTNERWMMEKIQVP